MIQTRKSVRMITLDLDNKTMACYLNELKPVSDNEIKKEMEQLNKIGVKVKETSNYRLSCGFYCPHCNRYDYSWEEYGEYDKEDNYITKGKYDDKLHQIEKMYNSIESVRQNLEICDANISWIDDKICSKCGKPYSIINGA